MLAFHSERLTCWNIGEGDTGLERSQCCGMHCLVRMDYKRGIEMWQSINPAELQRVDIYQREDLERRSERNVTAGSTIN